MRISELSSDGCCADLRRTTQQYLGIVTGEEIVGANIFRDLFANIRDIVGGRSGSYERILAEAREQAIEELQAECATRGGNAVVGVDLDYEVIGQNGSMLQIGRASCRERRCKCV